MESAQIVSAAAGLIKAGRPLQAVHREVTRQASNVAPSRCWQAIADIDTHHDVAALATWLAQLARSGAIPADVSGLWFGLCELLPERGGTVQAAMELAGGPGFPDQHDWLLHLTWRAGYAALPGLGAVLPLAASGTPQVRELAEYAVVLTYAMALTLDAIEAAELEPFLESRPVLGIATGFHDGDIALIGIARNGRTDRSEFTWI
jgi:hypothetical protein